MTKMTATTIEQSKELLRLGLPAESADMYYDDLSGGDADPIVGKTCMEYTTPAWSLSALLEVMPKRFDANCLKLERGLLSDKWFCQYYGGEFYANEDPITAAYEMVCWLIENGYIEKGGEE